MTQGVEYNIKEIAIPDTNSVVELHLLDIAGQSIFKDIAVDMLSNANMIMLVYDVTSAESFNSIKFWYDEIKQANPDRQHIPGVVVATKIDQENRIKIYPEDGRSFAEQAGLEFYESSPMRN